MRITCPSCGCAGSLELFMADREFREAIMAAADLPSNCGALVLRYVGLSRPATRQLTPARASKLIVGVAALIAADEVRLGYQCEKVLAHTWQKALQATLDNDKLTRPLKNNNYLIKVALSMVNQFEAVDQPDPEPVRRASASTQGLQAIAKPMAAVCDKVDKGAASNPLHDLDEKTRQALFVKAEKMLLEEGFKKQFIVASMIESMAISILKGVMGQ